MLCRLHARRCGANDARFSGSDRTSWRAREIVLLLQVKVPGTGTLWKRLAVVVQS